MDHPDCQGPQIPAHLKAKGAQTPQLHITLPCLLYALHVASAQIWHPSLPHDLEAGNHGQERAPCAWRQLIAAWLQVVWRDAKLENILMRSASCPFHAVSQCCIARGPQCSLKRKAVTPWLSVACSRLGKAACRDINAPPIWTSLQHSGMAAGQNLEGLTKKGSSKVQGLQHPLDFKSSLGSECCVPKKERGYTHV